MTGITTRGKGKRYEEYAAKYLQQNGYEIVVVNYRSRRGEIDIIAKDHGYLAFIEVKYRKSNLYGEPYEAVDFRKQRRIRTTAAVYMMENHYHPGTPCRFDVVSILDRRILLFKNAF